MGVGGEVMGDGEGLAGRVMGATGLAMGARGGREEWERCTEAVADKEDGGTVTEDDGLGQGKRGEEVGGGPDTSVTEAGAIDGGNGGAVGWRRRVWKERKRAREKAACAVCTIF